MVDCVVRVCDVCVWGDFVCVVCVCACCVCVCGVCVCVLCVCVVCVYVCACVRVRVIVGYVLIVLSSRRMLGGC